MMMMEKQNRLEGKSTKGRGRGGGGGVVDQNRLSGRREGGGGVDEQKRLGGRGGRVEGG